MSEQDEIKNEIVEEQPQEQTPEKQLLRKIQEMWEYAAETKYSREQVFAWILSNAKDDDEKLALCEQYVLTIVKYNTRQETIEEDIQLLSNVLKGVLQRN